MLASPFQFPAVGFREIKKASEFREVRESGRPLYYLLLISRGILISEVPFRENGTLDMSIDFFNQCVFFARKGE